MNEIRNETIAQEILHELFPAFEALETQSAALLQLLKDKGIANEEELAAHFEQAGKASSVRWLAVRVRIDYLLSSAMKTAEQDVKKESPKTTESPIAETSRERSQQITWVQLDVWHSKRRRRVRNPKLELSSPCFSHHSEPERRALLLLICGCCCARECDDGNRDLHL